MKRDLEARERESGKKKGCKLNIMCMSKGEEAAAAAASIWLSRIKKNERTGRQEKSSSSSSFSLQMDPFHHFDRTFFYFGGDANKEERQKLFPVRQE